MPLRRTPPKNTATGSDIDGASGFLSDSQVTDVSHNINTARLKRKRDSDIHEFMIEMRNAFSNFTQEQNSKFLKLESTLSENSQALKDIQVSNRCIEEAISFMSAQYDEFRTKINTLEDQMVQDRNYINTLENKIEELQRDSRKTNFEIKNVPKKPKETKEDLVNMIIGLSKTIDCPISKSDIKDTYRVRGKSENAANSPVIVETTSTLIKADIQKMCRAFNTRNKVNLCAKHLGLTIAEDTPIYVGEHLTPRATRLHFLARELKKSGAFKYCWTSYGKVYLRKTDDSKVILINSEVQIHQLSQQQK
ncbi:uncharacterized protein [Choristoneura fumiferana]|uniref:uncharacterized protein n=1 Tax=Choristoneura fumiferana TaxID=7141 RepID=UPI003D158001